MTRKAASLVHTAAFMFCLIPALSRAQDIKAILQKEWKGTLMLDGRDSLVERLYDIRPYSGQFYGLYETVVYHDNKQLRSVTIVSLEPHKDDKSWSVVFTETAFVSRPPDPDNVSFCLAKGTLFLNLNTKDHSYSLDGYLICNNDQSSSLRVTFR